MYFENIKSSHTSYSFTSSNKCNDFSSMEDRPETTKIKMESELPPISPASSSSVPASPGAQAEVLKMVARVLRNMEGVTSKNSERLRFLDPELKSTQSRIEVLEILCRANEDKINHLSSDLGSIQKQKETKNIRRNETHGKEVHTNNYFHTSETKETSRTERLSSKETNTKYIIERASDTADNKAESTQEENTHYTHDDPGAPIRTKFRSHDNIITCCLSPGEDDVFLLDNPIRKHESEPYIMHSNVDPKTRNFMKRLWGYEDVPETKTTNLPQQKYASRITIDHEPSEDCYLCT